MTEIRLEYLTSAPVSIEDRVLEAELENYTPLMAGGWDTTTFSTISGYSPVKEHLSPADLSKQLVGRTRWLLRTIIASCLDTESLQVAEKTPIINLGMNKNLSLMELLFGSTSPPWKSLYRIMLQPVDPSTCTPDDWFDNVSNVTRYKLITMSIKSKAVRRYFLPVKPGCRFKLTITRRLTIEELKKYGVSPYKVEALDELVRVLILIVLSIIGLGKGANRGFGRFRVINDKNKSLEKYVKNIELGELYDIFKEVERLLKTIDKQNFTGKCKNIITSDMIVKVKIDKNKMKEILCNIASYLPELKNEIKRKNKCIFPNNLDKKLENNPIYAGIFLIGLATMKAAWKACNKEARRGGGHYHTWVLGLPRRQKQPSVKRKIHHRGEKEEDIPVGYLIEYAEPIRRLYPASKNKAKVAEIVEKINNVIIITYSKHDRKTVSGESFRFVEGRRQSPFILFPVNNGWPLRIAILVINYPRDFGGIIDYLYHSGGFILAKKTGTPVFLDEARLAKVKDIAFKGIPRICRKYKFGTFVNDCVYGVRKPGVLRPLRCGCNKLPHPGIHARLIEQLKVSKGSLLYEAFEAAFCFLEAILSGECKCEGGRQHGEW